MSIFQISEREISVVRGFSLKGLMIMKKQSQIVLKSMQSKQSQLLTSIKKKGVLHRIIGGEDGPQRLTEEIITIIKN